jgi:hypothetical protein
MIISSVSIALTLGFWGLLASREKVKAGTTAEIPIPPQPEVVISAPPALLPGQKILFGGTAPQPQQQTVVTRTKRGGGGAVTTTSSSRP